MLILPECGTEGIGFLANSEPEVDMASDDLGLNLSLPLSKDVVSTK